VPDILDRQASPCLPVLFHQIIPPPL